MARKIPSIPTFPLDQFRSINKCPRSNSIAVGAAFARRCSLKINQYVECLKRLEQGATGINDVNDNVEHCPVILFHVHLHGA